MRPDAIQLLATVQSFLVKRVVDSVPAGMRSDVRAAVKSLTNACAELDGAYPLLLTECEALSAICQETDELLAQAGGSSDRGTESPSAGGDGACAGGAALPSSLSELRRRNDALLGRLTGLLGALERMGSPGSQELLCRIYRMLGNQGRKRLAWQSVFPSEQLISDLLAETWSEGAS